MDDHDVKRRTETATRAAARRLGAILYTASEWARAAGDEALRPLGLNVRQWALLTLVGEHGPMSQQEAGDAVGVDRTSMVALVDGLEADGLLVRERNPTDRRAYALRLTPAGSKLQKRGAKELDESAETFFAALSARERDELRRLLAKLVEGKGVVAEHLAR